MKDLRTFTESCEVNDLSDWGNRIQFCIDQMLKDRTHVLTDEISRHLTYEEVFGALVAGKKALDQLNSIDYDNT